MDLPTFDAKEFGRRVLDLLGVHGPADLELQKLADGSVRILREDSIHG